MSAYKAVFNGNTLTHWNKNHSHINGRFISGDGDGDGIRDDHAHRKYENTGDYGSNKVKAGGYNKTNYNTVKDPDSYKSGYRPASSLTTDQITDRNRRAKLEETYKKYYPSPEQKAIGALDSAGKGATQLSNTLRGVHLKETKGPRADLSKLSDADLRAILNREQMERQYDQYFNTPVENKGQKFVDGLGTALGIAGGLATLTIAGLTIVDKVKNK